MRKILIVGTGGREHAIAKALAKSEQQVEIYAVGGWINPGIARVGYVKVMDINNPKAIIAYARKKEIDTAIIGSENQLEQGLADAFTAAGIFCVGPTRQHSLLEIDKVFARSLIPDIYNPRYTVIHPFGCSFEQFSELVKGYDNEYVVKAVGLRGGKGVKLSGDHLAEVQEAFEWCQKLLEEDCCALVEERLYGEEFTVLAFADGHNLVNMPIVQDFKRLQDGDTGPNTGGMGCITFPNGRPPFLSDTDVQTAHQINQKVLQKLPGYIGILYGSFIKTQDGVKVIEYNCRFGDPEAINVLELLETDFVSVINAMRNQGLGNLNVTWSNDAMITSYVVAPGYPTKGQNTPIRLPFSKNMIYAKIKAPNSIPSTEYQQMGSRSFALWSRGKTIASAFTRNQVLLALLPQNKCFYRTDIGKKWLHGSLKQFEE